MAKRSDTRDAVRRRRNRAKERAGFVFLGQWVDRDRFVLAIQRRLKGDSDLSKHSTTKEINAAAMLVIEDFMDRWVPPNNPPAGHR